MKRTESTRSDDAAADTQLRQALGAVPADVPHQRIEALSERVLAQWHHLHARQAAADLAGAARPWAVLRWGRGARASTWMAGAAGLTACLAFAVNAWLQAPDPAIDDLLQPDVLSQMAAGEM